MKKSNLERALELVPNCNTLFPETDLPEAYESSRAVEKAYEELQNLGHDVSEQLKERRYQTAELICKGLAIDVENLYSAIKTREVGEGTLIDFFSNIGANTYVPRLVDAIKRLFPDAEKIISEHGCKIKDYFPEDSL